MLFLSEIWAIIVNLRYNGRIILHHINKNNMWEFIIVDDYGNELYKSKGIN